MVLWKVLMGEEPDRMVVSGQVRIRPDWPRPGGRGQNALFMGKEIERKFLVADDAWRAEVCSSRRLRQGYVAIDDKTNVRVRSDGRRAWLTVKGAGQGITRAEFEYEIPADDAEGLLELCQGRIVDKTRHLVSVGEHTWEVDEFAGVNAGLSVAEIELRDEAEWFLRPLWVGEEVTGDARYLNASLAVHPFREWPR
jgi:adenylate cyclase